MKEIISLEKTGAVATVTIDRGGKRNALSQEMVLRLTDIALELQQDTSVACIVLSGNQNEFSAGIDLGDATRWSLDDKTQLERRAIALRGTRLCKAWEDLPQITIAAVEGMNVGGGIALTLACDWRVMGKSAFLFVPEVQIGIPLGWQTIPRLVNLVGPARAKQIVLLGEKMSADTALEWGVADFVVADGAACAHAQELAARIGKMPELAVRMSKQSINAYANALNHLGSHMDVDQAMLCGQSQDAVAVRDRYAR
ncbi:enoyl-CoA hydratase/isomerase family protein [Bordetella bronchiseptica]|uniref:enoyl-CoA hydratase/isomerase family protein n=1 Tax=Bordetella bronchiseptica TaxID=518 RepID=UPI00028B03EA|nr:enoyl-CoA hydratase/isomerase family protein [Bordetella bronchiseptica]AUL13805.1 enoyl-CoA hydratase [Bordetella bronchiseptica]AWP56895.1 enoyl-CoA hydratase [Bordetella bronchiseptica]AWQ03618.1 enoyl-CoA hydratase [Bordetella bronchiseptica]KAK53667.1 enoyl-CoA hydratase/isomerase family protein [Bordetella bronchiseptica OSU054]KAK65455.1 enoyl-CoA hydratase/isomerase family protein [Bordetella bronchiseptica MO211]